MERLQRESFGGKGATLGGFRRVRGPALSVFAVQTWEIDDGKQIIMNTDPTDFLGWCDVIDTNAPEVQAVAARLADENVERTAAKCFDFVRDQIKHSGDFQCNPVTCTASNVLAHGTGYCYAKSHLLCALLRANAIPAGLCYQRLSVDGTATRYCLHGLNAAFLPRFGWYRMDARGNRQGIVARFAPPREYLAFAPEEPGEYDLPGIFVSPLPGVIRALRTYDTWQQVDRHLPDVDGEWSPPR